MLMEYVWLLSQRSKDMWWPLFNKTRRKVQEGFSSPQAQLSWLSIWTNHRSWDRKIRHLKQRDFQLNIRACPYTFNSYLIGLAYYLDCFYIYVLDLCYVLSHSI